MALQIFGRRKCRATQAAHRFFSDRRIAFQAVDLDDKGLSKGELESVARAVGVDALYDAQGRHALERGLQHAGLSGERLLQALLDDPGLLRTPIVRDGKRATVGAADATWKSWLAEDCSGGRQSHFVSIARSWGATAQEEQRGYGCDAFMPARGATWFRAVDVHAPAAIVFRWLCQLRAAPYSYDWLDNWGRPSPRQLTEGLDRLEVGQRVMRIFRLVSFEPGRSLTLLLDDPRGVRAFGEIAVTYEAIDAGDDRCRLVVKMIGRKPRGGVGALLWRLLPWGDLVMMRKQLLTFKGLAERDASTPA